MKKILKRPMWLFSCIFSVSAVAVALFSFSSNALDAGGNPVQGGELVNELMGAFVEEDVPNPSCLDNYLDLPRSEEYAPNNVWNMDFLPFEPFRGSLDLNVPEPYSGSPHPRREQFLHLNDDGLIDYVYSYRSTGPNGGSRRSEECVYLNNSHGWDLEYRCLVMPSQRWIENPDEENGGHVEYFQLYFGDCAAQ